MMAGMKSTNLFVGAVSAVLCVATAGNVRASGQVVAAGARYHMQHSVFERLPFGEGDMSYGLAYEIHEEDAFWQLAVEVAPDLEPAAGPDPKLGELDYAVTPQLNLLLKDARKLVVQGGVGVLSTYQHGKQDAEWMDPYFQFLLGLGLPLGKRLQLDVYASYPFKDWGALDQFEFEDVEFVVWLGYRF